MKHNILATVYNYTLIKCMVCLSAFVLVHFQCLRKTLLITTMLWHTCGVFLYVNHIIVHMICPLKLNRGNHDLIVLLKHSTDPKKGNLCHPRVPNDCQSSFIGGIKWQVKWTPLPVRHPAKPCQTCNEYNCHNTYAWQLLSYKATSLMRFWCLWLFKKDAKQCCDATKMGCTHCSGRLLTEQ